MLEDEGSYGVPERLRSLRASLDLSYQRLSGRARVVFCYLGVLPGGASERILAALVGKRFEPPAQELVARNLARWQAGRYTMLAPIRAYAVATRPSQRLARARLHTAGVYAAFARAMDDLLKPLSRRKIAEQGEGQTLNNLGQLYEAQGKLDEALRVYQQSLALLRETEDHSTVSTVSQWVEQLQQRLE